ncbi:nucleotidyltransferase family protein [Terracidiphilus gabretensis]|uniref:nucleotidyltransferase family protein n=1 Tax=Terracidiphilus gabretensis TaxID=1577687 RepID=UPI00071B5385|nr:nucleotidyltransferase family protein [Terracidiphilus gabretensis]
MKAMVLAAGLGTRLRPLTNDRPKALVEVAGRTLLEITLTRLKSFGVEDVIVNTHHFAEMVESYFAAHDNFGMRIAISHEDVLLDTGGGLKKAAWFLRETGEPFFLHNVDVLSGIDLAAMVRFHAERGALATLAVQARETSRSLLFDERGELCGRVLKDGEREMVRQVDQVEPLAFAGIHVISPRIFDLLDEDGVFSIIPAYLRMAADDEKIAAYRADGAYWRDMGRPESIAAAERDMAAGLIG